MRSPSAARQALARIGQSARQPVDPEPAVGVEHHLDDRGVFEKAGDRRPERGAQHARAARDRFGLEGMNRHVRPRFEPSRISALAMGMIRKGRNWGGSTSIVGVVVLWRRKTGGRRIGA